MAESAESLRLTLEQRLSARDRDSAIAVAVSAVRAGEVALGDLYDLLSGLLVSIGASWHDGATAVWEEHLASATIRTIIEACSLLVGTHAAAPNGHTVIFATPPEEYHDLGLRMTADRFALAGWTVYYLGPNVPGPELAQAVGTLGAQAVVLSAATHLHRLELAPYVAMLREEHPGLRVWVGGAAFAIEAHGWPADEVLVCSDIPHLAERMG